MPELTRPATIRVEERTLLLADLGQASTLPVVQPLPAVTGAQADAAFSSYGAVPNIYPYQLQDGYGRSAGNRQVPAVVLENSRLRAVVLPSLGGRLWELYDKASAKHLLHTQQRIQFANLALRNAWFAGGMEWNIGTRGHSPSTCSPLHTAIVRTPEGTDVLRMWEFERLRGVVFQIDIWLPEDSACLFVAVRIRNPNAHEVPMYWWSNAAVPETPGTRVLAPAIEAFATDYAAGVSRVRPSSHRGIDATWPARNRAAADYFFDLAPEQRPWIVAADDDGDGLALVSTARLRGRKLFVWGTGTGGRRWQEWLSPAAGHYAEIQAGLAQTQYEHLAMPAGAEWSWVEAYGNADLDAEPAHSPDWSAAVAHAQARVDQLASADAMDAALADARRWADVAPSVDVQAGSGWGALEARRRRMSAGPGAEGWVDETGTPFSAVTLGPRQRPWLDLLEGRGFPGADSFVAGAQWEELLEAARSGGQSGTSGHADTNPQAALHLAVMHHARQDLGGARERYEEALAAKALAAAPASLAHRGLGLVLLGQARDGADTCEAEELRQAGLAQLRAACGADPANIALLTEAMGLQLQYGGAEEALELVRRAPEAAAAAGRIRYLSALAHARGGAPARAAAMLREGIEVADLREGENFLADLWREVCPGEEVPARYQFSMQ